MSNTISLKDRLKFKDEVNRARKDPVYFIKEILGLKTLFPKQEEVVRNFYQHQYDDKKPEYKKLIWISGQRSGKTVLASAMLCYEFFKLISLADPQEHFGLLPHQNIACTCVAAGADQARDGVYSLTRGFLEGNPWFKHWNLSFTADRIDLKDKHVFLQIRSANVSTAAGYTNVCVVLDELDLFMKSESRVGAELIYTKMANSTMSLGIKGKIIAISSLQGIDGLMTKLHNEGQFEPTTLTYKLPTWEVNPNITKEALMEEYKYKMDAFYRDFANQPEVSTGLVFPGGVKLNKNMTNVFENDEDYDIYSQYQHVMAVDPAYRNDSFGLSVGYREGNNIVIDGVIKFEKEVGSQSYILPSDIEKFVLDWIYKLNVTTFVYDVDLVLPLVEKLENDHGITCVKHLAGEDAYSLWVNLNDGVGDCDAMIVYNEYLKREADQLIKKELPSGKIRYDHTYVSKKDMSDTVANCIWYLYYNDIGCGTNPVITGLSSLSSW